MGQKTTELKARLPVEMAEAIRTLTKERNQSMNDYVKRAIRNQLIADATHMETGSILKLVAQGSEPITRSANFAAVHAAATLAFLREWAKDEFIRRDEMPEDLAQEKAQLLGESALGEALATFEDPRKLAQFGWIERPSEDDEIPDWMKDDPDA